MHNNWAAKVLRQSCDSIYVGPEAASTERLLVFDDNGWTNSSLLMSGTGQTLTPADVAIVADGRPSLLCSTTPCAFGHDCVHVGDLPPVCVRQKVGLEEEGLLFVILLLVAITTLIYLTYATNGVPNMLHQRGSRQHPQL